MHVSAGMVGVMIETAKAFWLFLVKLWFRCFYMGLGAATILLVLSYAPKSLGIKTVSESAYCEIPPAQASALTCKGKSCVEE